MHLLPSSEIRLDDGADAVDLALPPGDVLVLSFADSDLSALAAAAEAGGLSLRLASLRRLQHPLSVDLLIEKTARHCRFVLVRCLGGLDYWRYGVEQLALACRAHGVALAVLPGDDRADERLADFGTVPQACAQALLAYFKDGGGAQSMRRLLGGVARVLAGAGPSRFAMPEALQPLTLPALFAVSATGGAAPWRDALAALPSDRPLVPILLYRSGVTAGDTALGMALAAALSEAGHAPLPLALTSLKDPAATRALAALIAARKPALIVTTTGFSARDGAEFALDAADCPILQAVPVGSAREAWAASSRGLSAVDLAMQVALPEFDGRLGAMPVAFKAESEDPATGLVSRRLVPDDEGIAALVALATGWIALAQKPARDRRLALVMSDYPARGGRAGFAVGLDTPASVGAIRTLLAGAGYDVGADDESSDGQALMQALTLGTAVFTVALADYRAWLAQLPEPARAQLIAGHGEPEQAQELVEGVFRFRAVRRGKLLVALQPPRDGGDRKTRYHDPDAPPGHGYLAFYLGLRLIGSDALIHLGTHGTMEWLPGKAVALSPACWPRLVTGGLPVIYPYVVDDPGEAAPAKRRLSAVTLGHLPPELAETGAEGEAALLRDLVEEFSQAQVMDPRRAALVAAEIRARAEASGLSQACGVTPEMAMPEALTRLDAQLCDIAELPFRDGLHIFGQAAHDPVSAQSERENLLRALDGRFIAPGPAGSPHRGRRDVLPTGRNLSTLDPRAIPTRAAAQPRRAGGAGGGDAAISRTRAIIRAGGDGSLGLADLALGRRGHRPCAEPDGRRPALGPCLDPRHRFRDQAAAEARLSPRRRDHSHLRRLSRHVSEPDRAARRRRPRDCGAGRAR